MNTLLTLNSCTSAKAVANRQASGQHMPGSDFALIVLCASHSKPARIGKQWLKLYFCWDRDTDIAADQSPLPGEPPKRLMRGRYYS